MQTCWGSATGILSHIYVKWFAFCNNKEIDKVREQGSHIFEGFCKIPIDQCNRKVHLTGGHFNLKR